MNKHNTTPEPEEQPTHGVSSAGGVSPGEETSDRSVVSEPTPAQRRKKGRPVSSFGDAVLSEVYDYLPERRQEDGAFQARFITMLYDTVRHITDTVPHYGQDMELKSFYQRVGVEESMSDRSVAIRVNLAYLLKTTFLPVFEHLETGNIWYRIAAIIPEQGKNITCPDALEEYIRLTLEEALKPGRMVPSFRKFAKEIAASLTDTPIEDEQKSVADEHMFGGVKFTELEYGFVELRIVMNAVDAMVIKDRVKRVARAKKTAQQKARTLWVKEQSDETSGGSNPAQNSREPAPQRQGVHDHGPVIESVAVLEHETATELLTGRLDQDYQSIKAEIRITVPLFSIETGTSRHTVEELQQRVGEIAGLSGNAHLEGFGPVPIGNIENICATQREWQRMFVNPDTGVVTATDKRKPSTALKRFLRFRDPSCRWLGCSTRADRCDVDHTIPWSNIHDTSPGNTAHLCRRHHVLKHNAGRKLRQLGDGVLEWTLPGGQVYLDQPYRVPNQRPIGAKGTGVSFEPIPAPVPTPVSVSVSAPF